MCQGYRTIEQNAFLVKRETYFSNARLFVLQQIRPQPWRQFVDFKRTLPIQSGNFLSAFRKCGDRVLQ